MKGTRRKGRDVEGLEDRRLKDGGEVGCFGRWGDLSCRGCLRAVPNRIVAPLLIDRHPFAVCSRFSCAAGLGFQIRFREPREFTETSRLCKVSGMSQRWA